MKKTQRIVCCLTGLLALPVLGAFATTSIQVIETFDYPGTGNSTQPQKISDLKEIVGVYIDPSLVARGFIRFQDGTFSAPIVDPADTGNTTQGRGINNSRLVCGDYLDGSTGLFHGFFLNNNGFRNVDVPGSTFTLILGLNNVRDFCGSDIPSSGIQSGFVNIHGATTEFTVPGATATLAYQINGSDQAAGYYIDSSAITHGYYRNSDGSIVSPIDPAGSVGTIIFGNNDSNTLVGRYVDAAGLTHGLLFIPPNKYVTYDFPGSTFTSLNGINAQGLVVGRYLDSVGIAHGIIARVVRTGGTDESTTGVTPQTHSAQESVATPLPLRTQAVEPAL